MPAAVLRQLLEVIVATRLTVWVIRRTEDTFESRRFTCAQLYKLLLNRRTCSRIIIRVLYIFKRQIVGLPFVLLGRMRVDVHVGDVSRKIGQR